MLHTPQNDADNGTMVPRTSKSPVVLVPATPPYTARQNHANALSTALADPQNLTPMVIRDTFDDLTPPPATQLPRLERVMREIEGESVHGCEKWSGEGAAAHAAPSMLQVSLQ